MGGSTAGKRGVAYGFKSAADLAALGPTVSWWYNWSSHPDAPVAGQAPNGIEFVPMVWGGSFDVEKLKTEIPAGAKYLLGFNEPNFGNQANLTPEQAAALWPKVEEVADARGLKIVSPALNYCGGSCNETNPFTWLQKFFDACTGCRVDYIALHWYACYGSALESYLQDYRAHGFTKPLWLTEFSCLDQPPITDEKEATYLQEALEILEKDPLVFRYSWFTGRWQSNPAIGLLDAADGKLSALGQAYAAYPSAP